jgi:RNA polymerase primary sigma factor
MQRKIERLYFKDISKYSVLTDDEEVQLIKKIQGGDREALDVLITSNLRFVVSVARKYQGKGLTLLELVNEGNLGLYKAAKRFRDDKEVKFISYAVWWVRQSIQKAIFEQSALVKIPPNKLAILHRFRKRLEENGGDFHKVINFPEFKPLESDIVEALEKISVISLDAPISSGEEGDAVNTLMDIIGVEADQDREAEKSELEFVFKNVLKRMNSKEEQIIRMYYGIGEEKESTLEEIGNKLSLTRERVRQIKNKALRKLFRSKNLKEQMYPSINTDDKDK